MFGKRFAEERTRLELSQRDLGEHLGVGRTAVGNIECGRASLDAHRLMRLGTDLEMDVLYVLTGERSAQAAGRLLDWGLVELVLKGMAEWSTEHQRTVTPEKTALLLRMLYDQAVQHGKVDADRLDDALRLAT